MPLGSPKTPCVGICQVVEGWGICYGCGRRLDEILDWSLVPDPEKDRIMVQCRDRLNKLYGDDGK
jgi:predicted Fe-S protein YdhL (DUF1289 family)